MRQVEVTLGLPEEWFPVPSGMGSEAEIVAWANETALAAWRLRADAGTPEEAVLPGAGERLVVELATLAFNLGDTDDVDEGDVAAVWVPVPELGVVNAVVLARPAPRTGQRTPGEYADALLAVTEGGAEGHAPLHVQRLEGEVPAGAVHGLHAMIGVAQHDKATTALEERTHFGVFPETHDDVMVEVTFVASRVASFDDMPTETLGLLSTLAVRVAP